jgi:hypothetical protein|tara:strand:+ start:1038 stop:1214 length:177 start_codon:yes stop_codon:yes gene_type:complete
MNFRLDYVEFEKLKAFIEEFGVEEVNISYQRGSGIGVSIIATDINTDMKADITNYDNW